VALATDMTDFGEAGGCADSVSLIRPDSPGIGFEILKLTQLVRALLLVVHFKPELFISVGIHNSANFLAKMLRGGTFRVCQDFIFGREFEGLVLRGVAGCFDGLAVQAPSMVTDLQRRGFASMPVNWLPCFPEMPIAGIRRSESLPEAPVALAYFGRLAGNKGLDELLRAFARAHCLAEARLDIWGDGPETAALQQLCVDLGITKHVSLKGRYPGGKDYARLMASYHGIVLASTDCEGLPLVLLEAMAYGVPFLARRVGAIPDCALENPDALLVELGMDALQIGLERFVSELGQNKFSPLRLQRYCETRFGPDAMASRWREMLSNPQAFFA